MSNGAASTAIRRGAAGRPPHDRATRTATSDCAASASRQSRLRRHLIHLAALLATAFSLWAVPAADAAAQTVRGRLLFPNNQAVNGAGVRVFNNNLGPSGLVYTGYDGMYYLNGIPPGPYELQIYLGGRLATRRPITVFRQPMTDIPPLTVRF